MSKTTKSKFPFKTLAMYSITALSIGALGVSAFAQSSNREQQEIKTAIETNDPTLVLEAVQDTKLADSITTIEQAEQLIELKDIKTEIKTLADEIGLEKRSIFKAVKEDEPELTSEQMAELKELKQSEDTAAFESKLQELGLPTKAEKEAARDDFRAELDAAIDSGVEGFNAWLSDNYADESWYGEVSSAISTQEDLDKLSEILDLQSEARTISQDLGLPRKGIRKGFSR